MVNNQYPLKAVTVCITFLLTGLSPPKKRLNHRCKTSPSFSPRKMTTMKHLSLIVLGLIGGGVEASMSVSLYSDASAECAGDFVLGDTTFDCADSNGECSPGTQVSITGASELICFSIASCRTDCSNCVCIQSNQRTGCTRAATTTRWMSRSTGVFSASSAAWSRQSLA